MKELFNILISLLDIIPLCLILLTTALLYKKSEIRKLKTSKHFFTISVILLIINRIYSNTYHLFYDDKSVEEIISLTTPILVISILSLITMVIASYLLYIGSKNWIETLKTNNI